MMGWTLDDVRALEPDYWYTLLDMVKKGEIKSTVL